MKWYSVTEKLPEPEEKVLVWMKYENDNEFEWNDSWIDSDEDVNDQYAYKEPLSGKFWAMGSAKGYVISHWTYVDSPS